MANYYHVLMPFVVFFTFMSVGSAGTNNTYPVWPFDFAWSFIGKKSKDYKCVSFNEPGQPLIQFWYDNFLCYKNGTGYIDPDLKFSIKGPIDNMECTKIWEPMDTKDWHDNYLCVPKNSPYNFKYSYDGCIRGLDCISLNEPGDKDFWFDNYLCNQRTGQENKYYNHFCISYSTASGICTSRVLLLLVTFLGFLVSFM